MMRKILLLAVLGATVSCSHHGPSPTSATSPTSPTVPGPPAATRLEILGTTSLTAAGQTTQLTAQATFPDGTTKDVTTGATWEATSPNVGSVSATGLFTALSSLGEEAVYARYGSLNAFAHIWILPPGTFKLSGTVFEPGLPLQGARVEILDGPSAGRSQQGYSSYTFYGVSGDLHVRTSKDGYEPQTKSVSMTQHQKLDFTLTPLQPPTSLTGRFALTLTASSSCTQLPPEAKTRHYTATIDQDGAHVRVTLSDATFDPYTDLPGNQFQGEVHGNAVTFTIEGYEHQHENGGGDYDVLEQLSPSMLFSVKGTAGGGARQAGMTLPLTGAVIILGSGIVPVSSCTATDHQLVFTPSTPTISRR